MCRISIYGDGRGRGAYLALRERVAEAGRGLTASGALFIVSEGAGRWCVPVGALDGGHGAGVGKVSLTGDRASAGLWRMGPCAGPETVRRWLSYKHGPMG